MGIGDLLPVIGAPFIGSFLLAGASRYPAMQGFVAGRSRCPDCRSPIRPRDLVPVISWALLRGRCRDCHAPIGWVYPGFEIAAAIIALWAAALVSGWQLWVSCALGWTLLTLSVIDWRCQRLPDALTLPMIVVGLAVTARAWPDELAGHLIGAGLGYGILAGIGWLYRASRGRDGLGLGDAKLLAAGGAWLSWQALPVVILAAAVIALGIAAGTRLIAGVPLSAATRVPFGPYLAAAIWVVWLYGLPELWP